MCVAVCLLSFSKKKCISEGHNSDFTNIQRLLQLEWWPSLIYKAIYHDSESPISEVFGVVNGGIFVVCMIMKFLRMVSFCGAGC